MAAVTIRDVPDETRDELAARAAAGGLVVAALTERLDVPLATLDLRLSRAPGPRCPVLTP